MPHYETVKGTPEQMRVKNFEIAQARAKLAEYRQRYGTDLGEVKLLKADPQAWKLTQLSPLDSDYLAAKKKVIDKMFGGALTQATKEGLIGAGNTVIAPAGVR